MKKILFLLVAVCLVTLSASAKNTNPKNTDHNMLRFDEGTKIKMVLDGKTYDLQLYNLNYHPDKEKTKTDAPFNVYQLNTITVTLRTGKIDQDLMNWILNPEQQPKDGQIIVYDSETGKVNRTITFTAAKTSSYSESGNIGIYGNSNQLTNFGLTYKTISVKF